MPFFYGSLSHFVHLVQGLWPPETEMPRDWHLALPVVSTLKGRCDKNLISRSPGHQRHVPHRRSAISTSCFAVLMNATNPSPLAPLPLHWKNKRGRKWEGALPRVSQRRPWKALKRSTKGGRAPAGTCSRSAGLFEKLSRFPLGQQMRRTQRYVDLVSWTRSKCESLQFSGL